MSTLLAYSTTDLAMAVSLFALLVAGIAFTWRG